MHLVIDTNRCTFKVSYCNFSVVDGCAIRIVFQNKKGLVTL